MTSKVPWVERVLQFALLGAIVFVIFYMTTYVSRQREVSECHAAVDKAIISSITAGRQAGDIEADAMDSLVNGLLLPGADPRSLLRDYQGGRQRAADLRIDNPLPDPDC